MFIKDTIGQDIQRVFRSDKSLNVEVLPEPYDGGSQPEAVNLAFLISLSITFTVIMIVLVVAGLYVMLTGEDEDEFDMEANNNGASHTRRMRSMHMLLGKKKPGLLLDSSFTSPGRFDDAEHLREREQTELPKMSNFEVALYKRSKEYNKMVPPIIKELGTYLHKSDLRFIKDRGIQSYFFLPSINDNVDINGNFLPSFLVQDKLDILFTKNNQSSSTISNYPLPINKRDAVYFEVKIYKFPKPSNTIFSIGLVTAPYPYFRIPGMSKYSIAYESTGKLRVNNPFTANTLLPKLQEGDVVGFGYRYKYGSIFITHNGKKLMDVAENIAIDLFVSIGAMNASYTRTYTRDGLLEDPDNVELRDALSNGQDISLPEKLDRTFDVKDSNNLVESDEVELQVNLGQIGFVFIEANVKKYSFGKVFGDIGIPPSYNGEETKKDLVLQKGDDLPPNYLFDDEEVDVGMSTSNAALQRQPTTTNNSTEGGSSRRGLDSGRGTSVTESDQNTDVQFNAKTILDMQNETDEQDENTPLLNTVSTNNDESHADNNDNINDDPTSTLIKKTPSGKKTKNKKNKKKGKRGRRH